MSAVDELLALPKDERRAWLTGEASDDDLAALIALSRSDHGTPYVLWKDDPVGFCEDVLGDFLTARQKEILESTVSNRRTVVPASHAVGKALRDGTLVLTPDGWRKIEDLTVGDHVVARDGTPTEVLGVYPQGIRRLYRITLDDGATIDADADHLWHLVGRQGSYGPWPDDDVLTTAQILDRVGPRPTGWRRPRLPTVAPVAFPARPVPLDPYVLGVLLGDGSLRRKSTSFTSADPEIVGWVRDAVDPLGVRVEKGSGRYTYGITVGNIGGRTNAVTAALRDLGLCGALAPEKHVPDVYLWNEPGVRLAVLRGLCDTDGTPGSGGAAEFDTTSDALADGIEFLARSLGAQVRRTRRTSNGYRDADGTRRPGLPSWRLRIVGGPCPFRLSRKADVWRARTASRGRTADRFIVAIDEVEPGPATCIRVSHVDALFVVDGFVVTHNSRTAARRLAHQMACHRPGAAKAISTAPTGRQVRNVLWPHVHAAHKLGDLPGRLNQIEWVFDDLSIPTAYGFSPSNYDESAVQGVHADESLLIVVDEAGGIAHQLGQALDSITTGNTHVLAIGNPATDSQGSWFETITELGIWNTIHISAFDSPNFCPVCQAPVFEPGRPCEACGAPTEWCPAAIARNLVDSEWVDDIATQYGKEDPFYEARVLAIFPKRATRRAIPADWVEWSILGPDEVDEDAPNSDWQRLGVDVAAGGGDEMVVAWADGFRISIPDGAVWSGVDAINQVVNAERVLDWIRAAEARQEQRGYRENPVRVKIDSNGIGAGTADVLERMGDDGLHGADIVRVNPGEAASEPERFVNRRAEMWWTLRELCRDHVVRLAISDRERKQLQAPTYTDHKHGGRTLIESKADLKKRGVNSPDRADAIIMSIYEPNPVAKAQSHRRQTDRATFPRRVGEARRRGL